MKSNAVIHAKHKEPLFLDEIDIPDPKSDEVIVKLFASGLCGSQLINLHNPRAAVPEILGHEGTGLVIKKGKEVKHVDEGDHVLIGWLPYGADEKTEYFKWSYVKWRGQEIKSVVFTWAEHALMNAQFVSKMDKDIDKYVTAVLGCAGIAGYGTVMNCVEIKPGRSVAVFGVGGLGVLAVNAAKSLGADPVIAIDIDNEKLDFSKLFGATDVINSKNEDPVEAVKKITKGGADFVFDMVGSAEIRESTILAAKDGVLGFNEGGTIVLTGFPKGVSEFNPRSILMGQRTYKGSRGGACIAERDFPLFLRDYKEGRLLLDKAITRRYKFEQINEAMEDLAAGRILGRAILEIS